MHFTNERFASCKFCTYSQIVKYEKNFWLNTSLVGVGRNILLENNLFHRSPRINTHITR